MRLKMILKTFYLSISHLTQLPAPEYFIEFHCCENLKLYTIYCVIVQTQVSYRYCRTDHIPMSSSAEGTRRGIKLYRRHWQYNSEDTKIDPSTYQKKYDIGTGIVNEVGNNGTTFCLFFYSLLMSVSLLYFIIIIIYYL
jgi:hypothetical protein